MSVLGPDWVKLKVNYECGIMNRLSSKHGWVAPYLANVDRAVCAQVANILMGFFKTQGFHTAWATFGPLAQRKTATRRPPLLVRT